MFKAIQKSKAKKGFTLVELIVVIAIIAILMLVLVPSLLAYINKANRSKAESNAKMVYDAVLAAYTDVIASGKAVSKPSVSAKVTEAKTLDEITGDKGSWDFAFSGDQVTKGYWFAKGKSSTSDKTKGEWAEWPAA